MEKDQIIFLMSRIQNKANQFLLREMKAHQAEGLAVSHGEILGALMVRGPSTMSEIAGIIGKDKSTITALVNKLIRMGYVEKRKEGADQRFSVLLLTPRGEALKPAFFTISRKLRAHAYRNIPDEDYRALVRLLTKLYENF